MRRSAHAIAVALALLASPVAPAQDATPVTSAPPAPKETPTPAVALSVVPAAATPRPAGSGSLADSARKNRAQATPSPTKKKGLGVINNESLKKGEGTGKGSLQVGPAHPIAPLPQTVAPAAPGMNPESVWRSRADDARRRVENAESNVRKLEVDTKRMENDFYAWSDGTYRDRVIKPAWDQAREDLRKARSELDAAQAGLSDLEEEARKAGVPAGWLREAPQH